MRTNFISRMHVVFGVCRLIDILVPDIPESLELKIKRERYLAKQALQDSDTIMKVAAGVEEDVELSCKMVLDLTAELGDGEESPGSQLPTIPIQLPVHTLLKPAQRSLSTANVSQQSKSIHHHHPRPKSEAS
uniref:Uncharacterized protein n=1 Tax=Clastoptera arizonana TaxID=38151 RepID=A0A1B6CCI5_9HEMI